MVSAALAASPPAAAFDDSHYASSMAQKAVRSLQLGPKYFFWDLPRYVVHRWSLGLPAWDPAVLWNPFLEFRSRVADPLPLPPGYIPALRELTAAGVRLALPKSRLEGLVGVWWSIRGVAGDVIECGSYLGATTLLLAVLGRMNGVRQTCLMLDTFAGMPAPCRLDGNRSTGEFTPPRDAVAQAGRWAEILGVADRIEIHPGLFTETFRRIGGQDQRYAFVHIDANLYSGTREACEFVFPRLAAGGAVVFDDYNGVCDLGARLAIDQSIQGHFGRPRPLAACSAYLKVPGDKGEPGVPGMYSGAAK